LQYKSGIEAEIKSDDDAVACARKVGVVPMGWLGRTLVDAA